MSGKRKTNAELSKGIHEASEVSGLSALERRRQENIERNSRYLQELGINHGGSAKLSRQYFDGKSNETKQSRSKNKPVPVQSILEPVRRSSRIASLPQPVSYAEDQQFPAEIPKDRRKAFSKRMEDSEEDVSDIDQMLSPKRQKLQHSSDLPIGQGILSMPSSSGLPVIKGEPSVSLKPGFASGMQADLSYWCHPGQLATPCETFGKAAIMSLSLREEDGYSPRSPISYQVRFNKYCGVAEWSNALYLWVNISGAGLYDNAFSAGGRHMMWYGGSTMHAESRIVQRLIDPSNQAVVIPVKSEPKKKTTVSNIKEVEEVVSSIKIESNETRNDNTIILFVRLEGEGYVCLGRCQYVAVDLNTHPIAIKWMLVDYEHFQHNPYFQLISKQ